jgi:lysophospholipase L1-like esterase
LLGPSPSIYPAGAGQASSYGVARSVQPCAGSGRLRRLETFHPARPRRPASHLIKETEMPEEQRPPRWMRTVAAGAGTLAAAGLVVVAAGTANAAAAALPAGCAGTSPITCHYDVPPGNYHVTVSIGSASTAGNTAMSVEARRLMLPAVDTATGTIRTYRFAVNVREPEGQPTGQGGTGNPGLDITFGGSAPQVRAVRVTAATNSPVVYLAGDSTVCDQSTAPYTGWGQMITAHVPPWAVVANYADSGESSGSFLSNAALFPAMRPLLKPRDLVLIQFGHNDKETTAADYRANLAAMISQVRGRGAVPVLVTPPVRRWFTGTQLNATGLIVNGLGVDLPAEMRAVGTEWNVPVIDLTAKSEALVEALGPADSAAIYLRADVDGVRDNTHFSEYGAGVMAELVLQGARELSQPSVAFLR